MNDLHRTINSTRTLRALAALAFACAALVSVAYAQDKTATMTRQQRAEAMDSAPTQIFHLKNEIGPADMNEISTALRQVLGPEEKVFVVPSQQDIVIRALPDDLAFAARLIDELDRPRISFRLTYTVTEFDGTRRLSSQHYAMEMMDGQLATLRQGGRVPIVTGKSGKDGAPGDTQISYSDVGLFFEATLTSIAEGAVLKSAVEQSSVPDDKPAQADPVIHQTTLRSTTMVPLGKPTALGSLDIPGGMHHLEIEVLLEKLP